MKKTTSRKLVDAQELIDLFKKTFDNYGVNDVDQKGTNCCYFEKKVIELQKELSVLQSLFDRTRSRVEEHSRELLDIQDILKKNQ